MFVIFLKMFIRILCFSRSLATKCMSLNNEQCKTIPSLSDLNPVELNYYPFMTSLDKCDGNCNAFNSISGKICPK